MKNDTFTDAKVDVDKEECIKPQNAGNNRDLKNEMDGDWKKWINSYEKTLKISGQKRQNKLKRNKGQII